MKKQTPTCQMLTVLWGGGFLCAGHQLLERSTACGAGTQPHPSAHPSAVLHPALSAGAAPGQLQSLEEPQHCSEASERSQAAEGAVPLCPARAALEDQGAQSI